MSQRDLHRYHILMLALERRITGTLLRCRWSSRPRNNRFIPVAKLQTCDSPLTGRAKAGYGEGVA